MSAGRGPGSGRSGRDGASRLARDGGAGARPGAGSRPGVRPAPSVAGRPARTAGPNRPARLRRVAALGVVAVVLAVLLAPAMRSYVAQRSRIDAAASQVDAQRRQVASLTEQRAAWDDPAYVRAQARERLAFVMPGDRAYTVIEPAPAGGTPTATAQRVATPPAAADRAWFGRLWTSVQVAGSAP